MTDDVAACPGTTGPPRFDVVRRKHPGKWVAMAMIAVLIAMATHLVLTNDNFQWAVVRRYLFAGPIIDGVLNTLRLTALSMIVGVVGGVLLAISKSSSNGVLSLAAASYIWAFRSVPLTVQLLFWFYLAALEARLSVGVPFGPEFFSGETNSLISPLAAAILGLGLHEGAYMAEVIRSGILSVPRGQTEAALALGIPERRIMQRIVLPQAMRIIIPPTGNELIGLLKSTSIVLIIGYTDLLTSVTVIYSRTFETIALLTVATAWYAVIVAVLSVGQHFLETHYGRGYKR